MPVAQPERLTLEEAKKILQLCPFITREGRWCGRVDCNCVDAWMTAMDWGIGRIEKETGNDRRVS